MLFSQGGRLRCVSTENMVFCFWVHSRNDLVVDMMIQESANLSEVRASVWQQPWSYNSIS